MTLIGSLVCCNRTDVNPTTIAPSTTATNPATSVTETITNNPTNPPTSESEGDTATASRQNASTTTLGYSESNSVNYGELLNIKPNFHCKSKEMGKH